MFIEEVNIDFIKAPGMANISNTIHWVESNDRDPLRGLPKKSANTSISDDPINIGHAVKSKTSVFFVYTVQRLKHKTELQNAAYEH